MIDDMQRSIQLTQSMTPFQMEVAAEVILSDYYFLKMEEVRMCFVNAISGKYGKIFNRIDVAVICEWLSLYMAKRSVISEKLNSMEAANNNIYEVFNNDIMRNALTEVVDKMKLKEVEPEKQPEPERKISPFEKMVLDEWDKLPVSATGLFKEYNNAFYDFTDYRKKRFTELNQDETPRI